MNAQPLIRLASSLSGLQWVQGPGGNVSLKDRRQLLVKASGTRLAQLAEAGSLVAVPRSVADAALAGDPLATHHLFERTPRPSLETWLHALPGRYVVHTHPVGVLALACTRIPAPSGLTDVPFALPGRALALELLRTPDADAWLLRNHGLVVRAASARDGLRATRAWDVRCRHLAGVSQDAGPASLPCQLKAVAGGVHAPLPPRRGPLGGYLFPDAVVLASETHVPRLDDAIVAARLAGDPRPGVLVSGDGARWAVARHPPQLRDVLDVVAVHDWLHQHLDTRAVPLPDAVAASILDMPEERFRQLRGPA